ncbi:MAG: hypothetical protein PUF29_15730 [Anaerobutyricum hallii]|nr:hypothetical protein [Anaerobutyricum hallii]
MGCSPPPPPFLKSGVIEIIFYDFEVFKEDWLAVFIDVTRRKEYVIVNDPDKLKALYEANIKDIWVGFNNRHYDQYIMKGILLGMNPKRINDWIILEEREGWQFSRAFNRVPMINYDVMPNPPIGLKTMEGFLGSNIKETGVPFDINRKLTKAEIEETIKYCRHDVEQTIKIFLEKIDEFNAMHGIVQAFPKMVSLSNIGDSEARITAKVLGCVKQDFNDEFDYFFLPCLRLNKYKYVQDWFEEKKKEALAMGLQNCDKYDKKLWYKSQNLETIVAGIPHSFGFGGLHGAESKPIHKTGQILHVDVNNYYPSMLIAWGLVTRAATNDNYTLVYKTRKSMKAKQIAAAKSGNKAEAKNWKKAQLPYKKMLNALSGGMKDETNPAYDPRNNNCMCINGQLMLLDLIEHLEAVPGFELIQSNTDGLIIWIPDTDEAFEMVDDICWEWEQRCSTERCSILLELDNISEIYQKDVNNYLWVGSDGSVERIGAYVKELSATDNDLPILNKALVEYMVHKTPVEQTINQCNDLIMFQKIVKLSNKYDWVEHEHCTPIITNTGKRVIKQVYEYPEKVRYSYKSYRVFASNCQDDGRLLKRKKVKPKGEKFGNTPDHCFICNDDVCGVKAPQTLDKSWYIDLAKKRLKQFGIVA